MSKTTIASPRITSIDLLRGIVMIIMALDHIRDYFHYDAFFFNPTDLVQTNSTLFFTRFITHYCAPVFVLLAGTSAFFVGRRLDKSSLSIWLLKRGAWLVFLELTIVKFAWYFKLDYMLIELMVIWALGISMICLAGFIHLPRKVVLIVCLVGIAGHNLLDGIEIESVWGYNVFAFFHECVALKNTGNLEFWTYYPLIPWIFLMPLGYYLGEIYHSDFSPKLRKKILGSIGIALTLGFFILRYLNFYGDPEPWSVQPSLTQTIWSFFKVAKYPPSLLYLMITLGPSFIFLSISESWKGKLLDKVIIIGQVPMFYYLSHLFIIHLFAMLAAGMLGFGFSAMILELWVTDLKRLQGYGFSLPVVYLIWIAMTTLVFYPLCRRYHAYKFKNKDKWWLSYL